MRVPLDGQDLVFSRFGEYVESLRAQAGIPGLAAAIVGTNDILWERAFGLQDIERSIAVRTDTPFHFDGLTQLLTSAMVLRCVEEGRLSLDDRLGQFSASSPDAGVTIRQVLSHASASLAYDYRPERLDPLGRAVRVCTDNSFRETLANLLDRLAMIDSVPGPDIIHPELLPDGIPTPAEVERYNRVLERLATPYTVDRRGAASPSQYTATALRPASGLVSTVRD
ncbi:MAG TPA: serine hydrolase domain-containing protein, partial [Planctomycetaceae bacterium]|nr:serine hydrolase domain-containing protein [Planctomycetaceae bacterium]